MKKILLVDDDELTVEQLSLRLESCYQVLSVQNGQEAIDQVDSFNPDLILMDIRMPIMDGYQACDLIREKDYNQPIIFLSGLDTLEDKLKAYDVGGDDFMEKPVAPEELLMKVENHLRHIDEVEDEHRVLGEVALQSLTELSLLGQIVGFYRNSYGCRNFDALSKLLFSVLNSFGLKGTFFVRTEDVEDFFYYDGVERGVDSALLDSLRDSKRILEFGRRRAAFNWKEASLLVKNMPLDDVRCGSMKDYLAFLMDGVEACIRKITIEERLRATVNQFKQKNEVLKLGIIGLIEDLEERLDNEFSASGFNDEVSLQMEEKLIKIVEKTRESADHKLHEGFCIEKELDEVLTLFDSYDVESVQSEGGAELF